MNYGSIEHFQTGLAIPVSGLKTHLSCGIGEFPDLVSLAQWAQKCGMDLIQLLPINDTGFSSSPYSALSAFALNPIYLRLELIKGMSLFENEIRIFREQVHHAEIIPYEKIYDFKTSLLKKLFDSEFKHWSKDKVLKKWIYQNNWVIDYSVYASLKTKNDLKPWYDWKELKRPTREERLTYFQKNPASTLFYCWVQWTIENQWSQVLKEVNALNIRIKGDIPILINEDSADVWAFPEIFNNQSRAGAPPDMFSKTGQNWGFPCYNWETLKDQNYLWWRQRIQQCNKLFHAIRIDHVLGFFRIWKIPATETSGILGQFDPSVPITKELLARYNLTHLSFDRLTKPHFYWQQLQDLFKNIAFDWMQIFYEHDGYFLFKPEFYSEKELTQLAQGSEELLQVLLECYWNRLLIPYENNYTPYWFWYKSTSFYNLSSEEQNHFSDMIHFNEAEQDTLWKIEGSGILAMMKEETDMLVCAEDLGAVPACVPDVLADLNLLGLKIERWAKEYNSPNEPFIHPSQYPRNSVCTPSCHDTSTLRGWWEDATWDHQQYLQEINWQDDPGYLTVELSETILKRNLLSNSELVIFTLQDWLSLTYDLRTLEAEKERVNIPGTVNKVNWNWKMKPYLEDLQKEDWLIQKIFDLIQQRRERTL